MSSKVTLAPRRLGHVITMINGLVYGDAQRTKPPERKGQPKCDLSGVRLLLDSQRKTNSVLKIRTTCLT